MLEQKLDYSWKLKHLLTIVLLLIITSCGSSKPDDKNSAIEVSVLSPKAGSIARSITLPGTVIAYQQAVLEAKVAGHLVKINVDKGDSVEAGQILAELQAPELDSVISRYKAELKVAGAGLKRTLASKSSVSLRDIDEAQSRFDVAKANLVTNQTLADYTIIRAPFAGRVTKRYVDVGAFIPAAAANSTSKGSAIVDLSDFNRVRVQLFIPEQEVSFIKKGSPLSFTVDGLKERKFNGEISRISWELQHDSRMMLVECEIENPDAALYPGMYARVRVQAEKKENVLLLPNSAIVREKSGAFVFEVAGGVMNKRPVSTGFNDGENSEILNEEFKDRMIVAAPQKGFTGGQAVRVREM